MKKILAILLAALMVFSLAACSTSGTPEKADEPQAPAQGEPEAEEEQLETASASSDENGVLMVYSPQAAEERGVWIKEHAEAALGFEINFLSAKGGELSERLRAEKNNSQADVIMGLVQTAMYQLKEEDLITPYVPSWTEGLPEVYQDPDGYFNSYWQTPIVIGYNTDYVTNPPASWQDLIKEEYKGLYSIGVNTKQTVRTYIVGMLWPYYDAEIDDITDEGWEFLKALYANAYMLPADSNADVYAMFKDGTLPITLDWFGGAKARSEANEAPIAYVKPENGTPIVAEGIAIVKGTKLEEKAKAFIEWWGSPETMAAYANEFAQAPAHPDAIALCSDEVKAEAEMFTAQEIDWEVCARHMDDWFVKIELEIMP